MLSSTVTVAVVLDVPSAVMLVGDSDRVIVAPFQLLGPEESLATR